jgi:hypothetical protein
LSSVLANVRDIHLLVRDGAEVDDGRVVVGSHWPTVAG